MVYVESQPNSIIFHLTIEQASMFYAVDIFRAADFNSIYWIVQSEWMFSELCGG